MWTSESLTLLPALGVFSYCLFALSNFDVLFCFIFIVFYFTLFYYFLLKSVLFHWDTEDPYGRSRVRWNCSEYIVWEKTSFSIKAVGMEEGRAELLKHWKWSVQVSVLNVQQREWFLKYITFGFLSIVMYSSFPPLPISSTEERDENNADVFKSSLHKKLKAVWWTKGTRSNSIA